MRIQLVRFAGDRWGVRRKMIHAINGNMYEYQDTKLRWWHSNDNVRTYAQLHENDARTLYADLLNNNSLQVQSVVQSAEIQP